MTSNENNDIRHGYIYPVEMSALHGFLFVASTKMIAQLLYLAFCLQGNYVFTKYFKS